LDHDSISWLDHDPPVFMLLDVTRMTGTCCHTQLFSIERGSLNVFCLGWLRTATILISASCANGMIGTCHCAQLLVWESQLTFSSGWPRTMIHPILASQIPRITGMSHHHLADLSIFLVYLFV
jgi:hypothetical protein